MIRAQDQIARALVPYCRTAGAAEKAPRLTELLRKGAGPGQLIDELERIPDDPAGLPVPAEASHGLALAIARAWRKQCRQD